MFRNWFGKYRFLVLSIGLFLVFDLGVLVLNFYTSGKIAQQTELINLAGRQRTLSQQMSKATLYIKAQKLQQWVYQSGLEELRIHYTVFSETLKAFENGGQVPSTTTNKLISIDAAYGNESKAILAESRELWTKFENVIKPLMVDTLITDQEIKPASEFIAANNINLFNQMDRLVDNFTRQAERQTNFLRMIQVGGIVLATINFFFILFHFLKQLRRRDRQLLTKQHESEQILSTIDEGVFLVDETLTIKGQHSKYLETIFSTNRISSRRLPLFLASYFTQKVTKTAIDFVKLFYVSHVNNDLVGDLNPLNKVVATIPKGNGELTQKHLNFSFAPVKTEDNKKLVLVTVKDITDSVLLAEQEGKNEARIARQLTLFSEILPIDPDQLNVFMNESTDTLDALNAVLKNKKQVTDNYSSLLTQVFRGVHTLKGNAAALKFGWFADQLHNFETDIEAVQNVGKTKAIGGRDLLPITLTLKKLYDSLETIIELRSKLMAYGISHKPTNTAGDAAMQLSASHEHSENQRWFNLRSMADEVAEEEGIKVALNFRGFNQTLDSGVDAQLYPMAVQLLRNSIAHGIETSNERRKMRKPDTGHISISLSSDTNGNYRFVHEDDGQGFNYDEIRKRLVLAGLKDKKVAKMSNANLVRHTFSDRISTSESIKMNSGRGVGLPIVLQKIKDIGGKLKIRSVDKEFTQFIVDFKVPLDQHAPQKVG